MSMDQNQPSTYIQILIQAASQSSHIENCCNYIHIDTYRSDIVELLNSHQWKVEGSCFIYLRQGRLRLRINTEEWQMDGWSTLSIPHSSLVQIMECSTDIDVYILSYFPSFLQDVNISFSAISSQALMGRNNQIMTLSTEEGEYLLRYFDLIHTVMSRYQNLRMARHTISSLTAALFYQMVELVYTHTEVETASGNGPQRQLTYVHDFIKLVHLHFTKERTVSFYAQKLFISPKYLSLLVKEATGRSAAQWIDQHVITEAKNLLRYSGKNIQQVAYALNFSNQSSFGKYFKHLTGMSPTEYQKS